ncbi:hypothetical protein T265_10529 [Opisthorchis viverrini]|uniref:Uncharacterized protein n=1 Tax=Opisthorchis viverrini TaxID=6198 RepID=A0A074ZCZ1_OPIVI|nr:hypothetical protein T265_10529 [Opisthorchis viverrini]KER21060.1 hypothetical protein T265_10529 [Opisthorchis viverrini]
MQRFSCLETSQTRDSAGFQCCTDFGKTSLVKSVWWNSTRIPLYRSHSDAATAEKPISRKIGQEFRTHGGPASSQDLIGRKSGPNSQS